MRKIVRIFAIIASMSLPWAVQAQNYLSSSVDPSSTLTVYSGTAMSQYVPAYVLYFDDYTRSQHIIPAEDLDAMSGGEITSITYYTTSLNIPYTSLSTVDVYLTEVDYTTLSAFVPKANATEVYSGTLDFVSAENGGTLTITFDEPYIYNGGNLLVGIENTTDAGYKSINFYGQTVNGASGANYDGNSLAGVTFSQRNFIPKSTFTYIPATDCERPTSIDATTVGAHDATLAWEGGSGTYNVEYKKATETEWTTFLSNTTATGTTLDGLAANTAYMVRVHSVCTDANSGWKTASFSTLLACPAPTGLAATLTPGDGTVATLSWTAGDAETTWQLCLDGDEENLITVTDNPYQLTGLTPEHTYTAKVRAYCDAVDQSEWSNTVSFAPTNDYILTVCDGTQTNDYVPIYGYWCDQSAKSQFIIPAEALAAIQYGTINKLTFYSSTENKTWGAAEFDILFSEVDYTNFESSTLVNWESMELVYHGAVSVSDYKMEIVFDNDYQYMGGNLLIGFHQTVQGTYSGISWYGVNTTTNTAIGGYENVAKGLNGQTFLPKTTFKYTPGEAPECPRPSGVVVNYTGGTEATVTWNAIEGNDVTYNIYLSSDPTDNGSIIDNVTSPYTLTNLSYGTRYYVRLEAVCGSSGESDLTNPVNFITDLCEDMCELTFELTDSYGDGWNGAYIEILDVSTGTSLGIVMNDNIAKSSAAKGEETETYTLAVCDGREIQFVWNSGNYDGEASYVVYDANGEEIFSGSGTMSAPVSHTVNCAGDNCKKPTDLAASDVTSTAATLGWTENGEATEWVVAYRWGAEYTEVTATVNPFVLEGLDPETTYYAKVRPVCSDPTTDNKWSNEIYFFTYDGTPATTYTVTATANEPSMGTVAGGGTVASGVLISLSATPSTCYNFIGWRYPSTEEVISTANPYQFNVEGDVSLVAVFSHIFSTVAPSGQTLYYSVDCAEGSASIIAPEGYGWGNYPTPDGNLVIPSTVTNHGGTYPVTTIASYAFTDGDINLASVTIPASVTKIEYEAIGPVPTVYFATSNPPELSDGNFGDNTTVSVPCGSLSSYQSSSNYSDFDLVDGSYIVIVNSKDNTMGSASVVTAPTCTSSTASVTAVPSGVCYQFTNWTEGGEVVSTDATYTFTATANRTLVANFDPKSIVLSNVAVSDVTTTGAVISWSCDNSNAEYSITLDDGSGSPVDYNSTGSPLTLTGLTPGTSYTATVTATCGSAGASWSGLQFTTPAPAGLSWSTDAFTGYTMVDFNNWRPTLDNPHSVSVRYGCAEGGNVGNGGAVVEATTGAVGSVNQMYSVLGTVQSKPGTFHIYAVHDADAEYLYDSVVYTLTVEPGAMIGLDKTPSAGGTVSFSDYSAEATSTAHYGTLMGRPAVAYASILDMPVLAEPAEGYAFTGWEAVYSLTGSGSIISTDASYTYPSPAPVDGNYFYVGLKAHFEIMQHTVTATSNNDEMGSVTGGGTYTQGATVTLTATPAGICYRFVDWTEGGEVVSTDATYTFTATASRTLVANFEPKDCYTKEIEAYKWYAIASPVHNDGDDETLDGVVNLTEGVHDLYSYNEAAGSWEKATVMGRGAGCIYRRAADATLTFVGFDNTGATDVSVTAQCGDNELKGFNLVGNPYPHAIGYSEYYTLNANGTWAAHTAGTIGVAEAFLVHHSGSAYGEITLAAAAPSKAAAAPAIALAVSDGEFEDVAYAVFGEGDGLPKIGHLNDGAPTLSIPVAGRRYAIAKMDGETESFGLAFRGNSGEYTLTLTSHPSPLTYCHLIDRVAGKDIDLLRHPAYTFSATGNDAGRFMVKLSPDALEDVHGNFAYRNGEAWVVEGSGTLQVYDVLGRKVAVHEIDSQFEIQKSEFPGIGVYVLRLGEKSQKIVVK